MISNQNAQRLAEIEERLGAATEGEWDYVEMAYGQRGIWAGNALVLGHFCDKTVTLTYEDAVFCTNAKQDIPWLCALVKKLDDSRTRRWSRRWKKWAKGMNRHRKQVADPLLDSMAVMHFADMEYIRQQRRRIAALEKVARGCKTCLWNGSEFELNRCDACVKAGPGLYKGWVFHTSGYAPRKDGME